MESSAQEIERIWTVSLAALGHRPTSEYGICFGDALLGHLVDHAMKGVKGIGVNVYSPSQSAIARILNNAWEAFWRNPDNFVEVEKGLVQLLAAASPSRAVTGSP